MTLTPQAEIDGLSGKVKFDHSGRRTDFTLDIVELQRAGLEKVGPKLRNID